MSYLTSIKVLLGTTIKQLNKAQLSGNLCMTELYLLNIVNNYIYKCQDCNMNSATLQALKKLAMNIQNKTSYICNIRNKPENHIFKFKNKNINNFFGEMATFNLNINGQINLPPSVVGDGEQTTAHATTIVFTRADFTTNATPPYADPEGDAAALLKVLSLPSGGDLQLNGIDVLIDQIIDFSDIDGGLLTYSPDPLNTSARIENFEFAIADTGSLSFTE